MTRKLLVCPYFGPLPSWWGRYEASFASLSAYGYSMLLDQDMDGFKARVKRVLGLEAPMKWGEPKIHDYRCCLGALYEEETAGYDWYGHTDFDVVYGHGDQFPSDEELHDLDVFSDHPNYLCGPFAIYRNTPETRQLFRENVDWREFLSYPTVNGWVERELTTTLNESGLRVKYELRHGYEHPDRLHRDAAGRLYERGHEISFFHFRRSGVWPEVR